MFKGDGKTSWLTCGLFEMGGLEVSASEVSN